MQQIILKVKDDLNKSSLYRQVSWDTLYDARIIPALMYRWLDDVSQLISHFQIFRSPPQPVNY